MCGAIANREKRTRPMSDIIHLLPDSVANQIAAGEVIQRPASIIKELVENALDAGATHIQVVVEDAGKSLVQVIDNGCGMSATDARMAFERHATSKIRQATDLFSLCTMGFRGEALASIAAVAQVELRTRQKDADLGTCLNIDGSKVTGQQPVSCPVGANFAVRNLFFNIPARRKFLKSNQTELTNILAEFERIALAHPNVAFTLHSGSNVMLDLTAGNFRQRIVGIFGSRIDKTLVPVEAETTLARISGFVGMPSSAKKKNAHQYLFVNGRYMRHPYFAKAIMTAYERLIADGTQVPFFVNFDVDPSRIDVNIHPTKTEIKFEDDSAIFQILLAAVREALGKYGAVPAIDFAASETFEMPSFLEGKPEATVSAPQVHINTSFNPFDTSDNNGSRHDEAPAANQEGASDNSFTYESKNFGQPHAGRNDWQSIYSSALGTADFASPENPLPSESDREEEGMTFSSSISGNDEPESAPSLFGELTETRQEQWKPESDAVLQYRGQYLITSLTSGLALIDQHRAHIRVLYEHYIHLFNIRKAASQRLLFPEMLTLSPSESVMMDQICEQLTDIGFDISPLGNGSYSIMATPSGTEGLAATTLVSSILSDALNGGASAKDAVNHIIALSMAKKVAIPVGQFLSQKEANELLEKLFSCSTPNLTPDGLPTMALLPPENIQSWF